MNWLSRHRRRPDLPSGSEAAPCPTWAKRLEAIGQSLDESGAYLRDVAVMLDGDSGDLGATVSTLVWRPDVYYGSWVQTTDRLEDEAARLTARGLGGVEPGAPKAGTAGRRRGWVGRLSGVGMLVDRENVVAREMSVLDIEGGVIVAFLAVGDDGAWELQTREFGDAQIEAASAPPLPMSPALARDRRR